MLSELLRPSETSLPSCSHHEPYRKRPLSVGSYTHTHTVTPQAGDCPRRPHPWPHRLLNTLA